MRTSTFVEPYCGQLLLLTQWFFVVQSLLADVERV